MTSLLEFATSVANTLDENTVLPLSEAFGRPPDQFRLFVVFILQYPNGWFMYYFVHGTWARHIYSIVVGLLIQSYVYGFDMIHVFLISGVAYAIMNLAPRHKQAPIVMVWVLAYLSYNHLYMLLYHYGAFAMDITSQTMLLVCKLSALAYCYQDGMTDPEKLTADQRARKVIHMASPLEFASYVWFCQQAGLGVFYEYSDYIRFIEKTHEYKDVPSPILPSLVWFLKALLTLAVYTVVGPIMSVETCFTKEFLDFVFVYRVFFYYIAMSVKRFFYYTPFCMTTGSMIASGLGYNGMENGEHKWDKIVGVYIWEVETAASPMEMFKYWNHQVHLWLKFYIMARLVTPGKRPGMFENMATFIVSAFWHGFYPFYYVMFFFAAVLSEVAKDVFKARSLFTAIPSAARPWVANFCSMLCMNYFGILQVALTFERGGSFMSATYAFVPIGLLILLTASRSLGLVKYAQKLEAKKAGTAPKVVKDSTPTAEPTDNKKDD